MHRKEAQRLKREAKRRIEETKGKKEEEAKAREYARQLEERPAWSQRVLPHAHSGDEECTLAVFLSGSCGRGGRGRQRGLEVGGGTSCSVESSVSGDGSISASEANPWLSSSDRAVSYHV